MSKQKNSPKKPLKNFASFLGIGAEMGVIIFLSNFFGKWLDTRYQTAYYEDILTLGGVFLAMFMVIYRVNRFNKK